MCYPHDEFAVGAVDDLLDVVEGWPFYMGAAQFEYWQDTHLTLDVVRGRGSGFSLEAPGGGSIPDSLPPVHERGTSPAGGGRSATARDGRLAPLRSLTLLRF